MRASSHPQDQLINFAYCITSSRNRVILFFSKLRRREFLILYTNKSKLICRWSCIQNKSKHNISIQYVVVQFQINITFEDTRIVSSKYKSKYMCKTKPHTKTVYKVGAAYKSTYTAVSVAILFKYRSLYNRCQIVDIGYYI